MGYRHKSSNLTRRTFIWSAVAGGLVAGRAFRPRSVLAEGKRKLRYVIFGSKSSVWAKPYDFLSEEVDKRSGGELEIQYTGGSEVIAGFDAPEAVANGVFDMSHSANSYFASAMPSSISLASGKGSVQSLREAGVLDAFDKVLQDRLGVKLLGVPLSGVGYVFMTRDRPDNLDYYKGKKIRSIPLYDPILQALGSVPVTTDPAEAYTALERGVVDGVGWSDIGLYELKFHEQAKFMMAPDFYRMRTCTLINKQVFDELPGPLQTVLVEAAQAADQRGEEWCVQMRNEEHAEMKKEGLEVVELPPEQAAQFIKLAEEKLWAQIVAASPEDGPRLKSLFEKVG